MRHLGLRSRAWDLCAPADPGDRFGGRGDRRSRLGLGDCMSQRSSRVEDPGLTRPAALEPGGPDP